jgi:hypothetical protein
MREVAELIDAALRAPSATASIRSRTEALARRFN